MENYDEDYGQHPAQPDHQLCLGWADKVIRADPPLPAKHAGRRHGGGGRCGGSFLELMFTYKLTTTCLKDLKDDYISNTRIVTNSCTILNTIIVSLSLLPPLSCESVSLGLDFFHVSNHVKCNLNTIVRKVKYCSDSLPLVGGQTFQRGYPGTH